MNRITQEHLNIISKAINDYAGIVLERIPQNRAKKKIINQMNCNNCKNVENYIELLLNYENNSSVMDDFVDEITISESCIFRNPKQFEYLKEVLFPSFFKNNKNNFPLRIWSAGCSHGEEAYSIAMLAKDFMKKNPESRFTINAGDINKNSLQIAKRGIYSSKSLQGKIDYFEELLGFSIGKHDGKGNCIVSDDIKEMVDFHWMNLKDINNLKIMQGTDIIFCRNVLIYFDEVLRKKLLETFFECLNPNGLLFIGECECFNIPEKTFAIVDNQGSYAYRKSESK